MTPDTFMDTFTLVRNSLEKQDTRFREAFPTEKRVAIAFGISHQRCSMKKGLRPATLLKKRLWHRCFTVNFAKFLRTPFLQNTFGWLLLWELSKYNETICRLLALTSYKFFLKNRSLELVREEFRYLDNEKSFWDETKRIYHHF